MLSEQEFQNLYHQKSKELVGSAPSAEEVTDAYKSYRELVDFTGKNGILEFDLNKDNGQLKVLFKTVSEE